MQRPRTTASAPRVRAGWREVVGLPLVSLVVFFGLLELGVRLAHPDLSIPGSERHFRFTQQAEFELPHHVRDPVLGWRLTPGTYGRMHVNRSGFRGPDVDPAAAPRGRRVAFLGDSCTMGFTIGDDRRVFSAVVADVLRQHGLEIEPLNFGVDGYSSHQGVRVLDEALRYAPDVVTLYFGYNDHHYAARSDADTRWGGRSPAAFLEKSHAYRFLRRHVLRLARREASLRDPVRRVDLPRFEANLRRMVTRAREAGATPVLLTTPLRPGRPLVENEVLDRSTEPPRWISQEWWVESELRRRGTSLQRASGTDTMRAVLEEGLRLHPEWPYLHWLHGIELQRRGDTTAARESFARAAARDTERQVMEAYNDRVRKVARDLDVPLVDLAADFARQAGERLFNDVVHPNEVGHRRIAEALATTILGLQDASPRAPRQPEAPAVAPSTGGKATPGEPSNG